MKFETGVSLWPKRVYLIGCVSLNILIAVV